MNTILKEPQTQPPKRVGLSLGQFMVKRGGFDKFASGRYKFSPISIPGLRPLFHHLPWIVPAFGLVFYLVFCFISFRTHTNDLNREIILDWLVEDLSKLRIGSVFGIGFDNPNYQPERGVRFWYDSSVSYMEDDLYYSYPLANNPDVQWQNPQFVELVFEVFTEAGNPNYFHLIVEDNILLVKGSSFGLGGPEKTHIEELDISIWDWSELYGDENPWSTLYDYYPIAIAWTATAYFILPAFLTFLVLGILLTNLFNRAPRLFFSLAESGSLRPARGGGRIKWCTFVENMEKDLTSRWKWATFLFMTVLASVVLFWIAMGTGYFDSNEVQLSIELWVLFVAVIFCSWMWIGPIVGLAIWPCYQIARYVRMLPNIFDIRVDPEHGDRCGGLSSAGKLCLNMVYFVVTAVILGSSMYFLGALTMPEIRYAAYIALLILLCIAVLTFLWPAWGLHLIMLEARNSYRSEASFLGQIIAQEIQRLPQSHTVSPERLQALAKQKDSLAKLYPAQQHFPTWPFNIQMSLVFLASLLPQLILTILLRLIEGA